MRRTRNFITKDKAMGIQMESKNGRKEYVEKTSLSVELLR